MSYSYFGSYSTPRSSSSRGDSKKRKRKTKKSDYAYFVVGVIAYPIILHLFNPNQQIEFGKNLAYAVLLGASALFGSIFSHRTFGITDKFVSPKEYGKFFLVFMVVFAVVSGWTMNNLNNSNTLYVTLIAYVVSAFVGVYASAPKKAPKKKIAGLTIVIGYIIYAGVTSLIKF